MRMNAAARILEQYAALQPHAPAADAAAQQLAALGLPDSRDEQWRYANLRALDGIADFRPGRGGQPNAAPAARALPEPLPDHLRLVLVDGRFDAALSCPPAALSAAGVGLARSTNPGPAGATSGPLQLLTRMFAAETLTLVCSADARLELCCIATAGNAAGYPTLDVQLAPDATLQLVERHLGGAQRASLPGQLVCASTRLTLAANATLRHYRLQEYGAGVLWLDNQDARLARDARLILCQIGVGAATARHTAHIALAGERAELHWQAMAVANGRQVNDTWVRVDPLARGTVTQQRFRGIAADQARVACSAELKVGGAGAGARVQQNLRGLIDGRGAEVDLRPRLEIRTDDIQASHGATTGQLDETLLFYLLSRGLDPATARTLLKWAFLGDVLGEITVPALRRVAEQAAAGQLADVLASGAMS